MNGPMSLRRYFPTDGRRDAPRAFATSHVSRGEIKHQRQTIGFDIYYSARFNMACCPIMTSSPCLIAG